MSHIFYKFKSAKDYDGYRFEGAGVPVWELKREIIAAKKLGKSTDFDLILTNAQTNEDYVDEMAVIPKNAQVVVRRVPASGGGRRPPAAGPGGSGPGRSYVRPFVPSSSGLPGAASAGGNEEEQSIRAMMQATSSHWEQNQQEMPLQQAGPRRQFRPSNYGRGMPHAIPPDTYVCFRCGQKGHYIQNCPTNSDPNYDRAKVRRTTGIPRSFLKPVTMTGVPTDESSAAAAGGGPAAGAPPSNFLVTPEGNLVIAAPNEREWDRLSTIKSLADTLFNAIPAGSIPDELRCRQCNELLKSAVRVSCCGVLFCDECLRKLFEEALGDMATATASSASLTCPQCGARQSPEQALPDQEIRAKVTTFIESHNKFVIPEGVSTVGATAADGIKDEEKASAREQREDGETSPEKQPNSGAIRAPYPPVPFPFMIPGFMPPPPPGMMPPLPFARFPLPPSQPAIQQQHPHDPRREQRGRSRSPSPIASRGRGRSRSRSRSP